MGDEMGEKYKLKTYFSAQTLNLSAPNIQS